MLSDLLSVYMRIPYSKNHFQPTNNPRVPHAPWSSSPMEKSHHDQFKHDQPSNHHRSLPIPSTAVRFPEEEVKLAAVAISLGVRLRSSDMPFHMQERALRRTKSLLDSFPNPRRPNFRNLARDLKKEFDSVYGLAWHCVVGTSFGSFVTHSASGFVYFSIDSMSVLLFKTEVELITEPVG